MEAIEPFDCSELRPFNTSYLQGFYAQRYDLSTDKLSDRILVRLQRYAQETITVTTDRYSAFKADACVVHPYDLEQSYVLLPVWFLNYKYDGVRYTLAMNARSTDISP